MAIRPVFVSTTNFDDEILIKMNVDFEWFPGFSVSQKQKSIVSMHEQIKKKKPDYRVLEISSKSSNDLGVQLSAFNLMIHTKNEKSFSVESAFQGSKVFAEGGPFTDLLLKNSREAKKDGRLKSSGQLVSFKYLNRTFPLEPKTFFYNWLYINALSMNEDLAKKILNYNAFTDIEFNPQKSINCQAEAAALYVSLNNRGLLKSSLDSIDNFKKNIYREIPDPPKKIEKYKQLNFFDL